MFASALIASTLLLAPSSSFEGRASEDGRWQYTEYHQLQNCEPLTSACQQRVLYRDTQGEEFADKTLEFSNDLPWQPNYRFANSNNGSTEVFTIDNGQGRFEVSRDGKTEQADIRISSDLVIDAGFHPFVQHHLPQLLAGERVRFRFLSSARMDTLNFRLQLLERQEQQVTLALSLQNALLRAFVSDIVLTYDLNDGRLLRYDGLTNIARPSGRGNFDAVIDYSY